MGNSRTGPSLIGILADVDPQALDEGERVELLTAWERCASWVAAMQARATAAVADAAAWPVEGLGGGQSPRRRAEQEESAAAEVGAALRLSPEAGARRVDAARALVSGPLKLTWHALARGEVGYLHALAIAEGVRDLEDEQVQAVEDRVLKAAATETVGRRQRRIRRVRMALLPQAAQQRREAAVAGRRVQRWGLADGMAMLQAELPAEQVEMAWTAIETLAYRRREAAGDGPVDEERDRGSDEGIDAARADALVDLLAAGLDLAEFPEASTRAGARPAVQVTVDLPTLLGLAEHPGELAGYGPIPAPLARALAVDGTWRRLVTDPATGALLDYGRRTYRPPTALREFLVARDRICGFPGCARSATRCDADHAIPYDRGGPTSAANCGMLCRRHHRLKTHTRWRLTREPDGSPTWTSPAGHLYGSRPHDYRPDDARATPPSWRASPDPTARSTPALVGRLSGTPA